MNNSNYDRVIQTRNLQTSFLDTIRNTLWNLRCMEHQLGKDKDSIVVDKLDDITALVYDAYHYLGSTRPERSAIADAIRERMNGKSESSEQDRPSI